MLCGDETMTVSGFPGYHVSHTLVCLGSFFYNTFVTPSYFRNYQRGMGNHKACYHTDLPASRPKA